MPRTRRARVKPPAPPGRLLELERRLGHQETVLLDISGRMSALDELRAELVRTRELALEAVAQAQDALSSSSLARAHEDRLTTLTLAVAEGIAHVDRAENRIRATIQRARQSLADSGVESPALEAEARDLQLLDGGGSEEGRVQPVRAEVEEVQSPPVRIIDIASDDHFPSSVPGMTRGELRDFWARRRA